MTMKRIETLLWLSAGGMVYLIGAGLAGLNHEFQWVGPTLWRPAWAAFVALSVLMGWSIETLQRDTARLTEARSETMTITPEERAVIESIRKTEGA